MQERKIQKNNKGRKHLIRGLSKEIFFILLYSLRAIAAYTSHFLTSYGFSFLLGKLNNDSIKIYFYKNRSLSDNNIALNMILFCNNEYILLYHRIFLISIMNIFF